MAGILDFLMGQGGASPWGALYPTTDENAKRQAAAGDLLASMGVSPTNLPPISPFDLPRPPAAAPAAPAFGAGATPFGFAGPGSMAGINPAMMAAPAASQAAQAPAAPSLDLSSVNRPAPAVAEPDSTVPVGGYQMPMYGEAPEDGATIPAAAKPTAGTLPASPAPFSLAGGGVGDRLMKGTRGFMGNMGGGPLGALAGGLGALVTGQNTDPASILAEKTNATGQALLAKGAALPEVQAAINNPALMAALIQQYWGKDKWGVVQVGEDENGRKTYMQQNQVDGTLRPIAGGPVPSGASDTVAGPDGKLIAIPPGANRKEFIKQVTHATADAATGKATEAQAKASSFAARMTQAEGLMGGLQNEGQSLYGKVTGEIPIAGNYLQSTNYQKYKQAASAFVTAMLRQESGAAINKSEFERYEKELFPQPGDDASVVQQKAAMRQAAIQQMTRAAGPGYQRPPAAGTVDVGGKAISWSVK